MTALSPAEIETSAQLAAALKQLCGTRSLREIEKAAKELSARGGRISALPTSTVSGVLNGKSVPSVDTLVALLRVCQVSEPAQQDWLEARDRVEHRHHRRPSGAVPVRDAQPRRLGVHAAIQTDTTRQHGRDGLPPYVPRDLDADLRTQLTAAEQQGGFVLLVGGSSVGKTRALFEAIRTELPNWWLYNPTDPDLLRQAAAAPTERTVVWLDELQNYLNHPGGLPTSVIRDLINAGIVVVATVWPGEYSKRVTRPVDGQPDPYAEDRQLLDLAEVVTVPDTFSKNERRRAENLAHTDSRIRVALNTPDAGFTQVMAAGPALIRHWEQAPADQCYGQAVITAALDARRVGAHAPATRAYLEAAAPGYLTDRQQASAPPGWLDEALTYATTLLHGATATPSPVASGMGRTAGYQVADYLHQHALRLRRTEHLPDTAWHALVHHHHPDDTYRLADNAQRRGRLGEGIDLYQQLVNTGDHAASHWIVVLLVRHGQLDQAITYLRNLVDNGDQSVVDQLVELLVDRGQLDEALTYLRNLANNGNSSAASRLVDLLVRHGQLDQAITYLRNLVDNGDQSVVDRLVDLLVRHGQLDEALTHLRNLANKGSRSAIDRLVELLVDRGQLDEALTYLRNLANNGNSSAASRLVDLLVRHGQLDQAITHLYNLANKGSHSAVDRLADLLAKHGRLDEVLTHLRNLVSNGSHSAHHQLVEVLAKHGRLDEAITYLRNLVSNGNPSAQYRLAELLVDRGQIDEALTQLRNLVSNGNPSAQRRLAELLAKPGLGEVLIRLPDLVSNGNPSAQYRLAELLVDRGQIDEALTHLRILANYGSQSAVDRLLDLLDDRGQIDEAPTHLYNNLINNDDQSAADRLADLLAKHGRLDELLTHLRNLANNGNYSAHHQLVEVLAKHGRLEELNREVAAGTPGASQVLCALKFQQTERQAWTRPLLSAYL